MLAAVALAGCGGDPPAPSPSASPSPSPTPSLSASTPAPEPAPTGTATISSAADAVTGLAAPWSVAVLPDGTALVSQRNDGTVLHLVPDGAGWAKRPAGTVPDVRHNNEGGLLGLAVAPGGDSVYAMFTTAGDNRVVRMSWDGSALGAPSPVLTGIPAAGNHNGGRLAFGPDGMLYISTGDASDSSRAQDPSSLAGKILRVQPDGAVPADNPFPGSPVYSLGHRNVQGLAFDDDGRLWASEFGSKDVDEINLIQPGANYGWPQVEGTGSAAGMTNPVVVWSPTSVASPSGIAYAQGSLWVASLVGRTLYQVPLSGASAAEPIAHFVGEYGRLRDVVVSPTGSLWLVTNNTDGRGSPRSGDDRIIELGLDRG